MLRTNINISQLSIMLKYVTEESVIEYVVQFVNAYRSVQEKFTTSNKSILSGSALRQIVLSMLEKAKSKFEALCWNRN